MPVFCHLLQCHCSMGKPLIRPVTEEDYQRNVSWVFWPHPGCRLQVCNKKLNIQFISFPPQWPFFTHLQCLLVCINLKPSLCHPSPFKCTGYAAGISLTGQQNLVFHAETSALSPKEQVCMFRLSNLGVGFLPSNIGLKLKPLFFNILQLQSQETKKRRLHDLHVQTS